MSSFSMDPWNDAATIAKKLESQARLVAMVGAESWCQTCRVAKPIFDTLARHNDHANDVWVWLDLEEHADFLDDFIPDSLPFLFCYTGDKLTHALVPSDIDAISLVTTINSLSQVEHENLPNIRLRLRKVDWAS